MAAITISRQLGSGGGFIARLVAAELGFRVLDRELVDAIAVRAGISIEAARSLDEEAYDWASAFVRSLLDGVRGQPITQESYRFIAARVIRQAVADDDVVVLGRAGQVVLGFAPRTLHVHVVAPLPDRVAFVAKREGTTLEKAQKRVEDSDVARRRYVFLAGHRDWEDPLLYDLIVNTHRLTPETAAGMIVDAARRAGLVRKAKRLDWRPA